MFTKQTKQVCLCFYLSIIFVPKCLSAQLMGGSQSFKEWVCPSSAFPWLCLGNLPLSPPRAPAVWLFSFVSDFFFFFYCHRTRQMKSNWWVYICRPLLAEGFHCWYQPEGKYRGGGKTGTGSSVLSRRQTWFTQDSEMSPKIIETKWIRHVLANKTHLWLEKKMYILFGVGGDLKTDSFKSKMHLNQRLINIREIW